MRPWTKHEIRLVGQKIARKTSELEYIVKAALQDLKDNKPKTGYSEAQSKEKLMWQRRGDLLQKQIDRLWKKLENLKFEANL